MSVLLRFLIRKQLRVMPMLTISMQDSPVVRVNTVMLRSEFHLMNPVRVMNSKIQLSVVLFLRNTFQQLTRVFRVL